jgi:hypothetical protein
MRKRKNNVFGPVIIIAGKNALFFGTEQGNTFFQGRDELLFFIARRAIVDGVNKKCYNY